ncbi:hypothetical protein VP01_4000g2 [Puccinia sorghi]|uniref:Uncharacterized protein n=1 Tax=Puccinia sorghi TaxID=27349 RepID=A0A0L6URY5_9BASI|nr:hypothetical protein VP01_4000g2 [Puccinia sorghi]
MATSPSTPTTPTATRLVAENQSDKQPILEKIITDIVRTMTKQIEIALSRTDRRFLAILDELPNILEEREKFDHFGQVPGPSIGPHIISA